jgi:predicted transcriptional regulator
MNKLQRMSDAEREVMQLIWAAGSTMTSTRLLEELKASGSEWKTSTVLTFLARLVEKGILTAVKNGRSNDYMPRVSESEYRRFETQMFLEHVHDGSVKSLIAALYESGDMTVQEIEELKSWFAEKSDGK